MRTDSKLKKMTTDKEKEELTQWFSLSQNSICETIERLEESCSFPQGISPQKFSSTSWSRGNNKGGGLMRKMQGGCLFEKAGVNVSTVYGAFSKEFSSHIPGADENPSFWASGISVVIHPNNPFVPAIHMNTRHIITTRGWFGGGIDLTPTFIDEEDVRFLQTTLKKLCAPYPNHSYEVYKKQCDAYFYLPHRQEPRGIGGIFYDYVDNTFSEDFSFTKDVGNTFLSLYKALVTRHMNKPWTKEDKEKQSLKRSRYAEFNLLYDRGIEFGLKTNGNVEAIFMSMPPSTGWL